MLCITVAHGDKHVNMISGKVIGASKHIDYALFHFKAHDVKALKLPIAKFVYVNLKGEVDEVILADQLKDRGVNYKTAKRDAAELTDVEQAEVTAAIEQARATPQPKAAEPAKAPAEAPPATITPEAVATGLGDVKAQPVEPKDEQLEPAAAASETAATDLDETQAQPEERKHVQPDAAAEGESVAEAETQPDTPTGPEPVEEQPEDPLSTVKPSRANSKKRRA
jgi:hypothetical protein